MTLREVLKANDCTSIKHIVSLSGGKDSAALAIYMRNKYPQIKVEYVFCDTGCELKETYEYLERLESILGEKINRVNALEMEGIQQKLDRSPFDFWLYEMYGGYLPSPRARWCTKMLKIKPFEAYVGKNYAYSYIGIRADENREGYIIKKPPVISQRPNIIPVYPFKDDNIRLEDINNILDESGLGLPTYYSWRSRSGCYFCFYQQIGEWQGLKEVHPDLFEKAKKYEKNENGKRYTWVDGRSLSDIENLKKRYDIQAPDESDGCAICHL